MKLQKVVVGGLVEGRPARERGARIETTLGHRVYRRGEVAPRASAGRGLKRGRPVQVEHPHESPRARARGAD